MRRIGCSACRQKSQAIDCWKAFNCGASDASFFRAEGIPVYDMDGSWGISPIDERAHGLDERVPVNAMYNDVVYWTMIYKSLAG